MSTNQLGGPLLIVDDREDVRVALRRYFSTRFGAVMVASTPTEALAILRREPVTAILSDYWLGNEFPPSTRLIPMWRKACPSVRIVVLMTGTKSSALEGTDVVDAVFPKPLDLRAVCTCFEQALIR